MNVLSKDSGNKACRPWAMTLQEFPQVRRPLDVAVISDLHLGMLVVRELLALIAKQKTVYCVTGNHDEVFRRFVGFQTGQLKIVNKVVLTLDGKKTWIFHGDVFDLTMRHMATSQASGRPTRPQAAKSEVRST